MGSRELCNLRPEGSEFPETFITLCLEISLPRGAMEFETPKRILTGLRGKTGGTFADQIY